MHHTQPASPAGASGIHSPAPDVALPQAQRLAVLRLIRLSDATDTALDAGLDFFAAQGRADRARLEAIRGR